MSSGESFTLYIKVDFIPALQKWPEDLSLLTGLVPNGDASLWRWVNGLK